jgi:site-specific recombinase XerD
MNPKYVQQLMGHAHYSTTIDIYTHVTKDLFEGESEKFGSILE